MKSNHFFFLPFKKSFQNIYIYSSQTNNNNNNNNNKLSTKQQIAMDNFLKAQTSGNPISKEEMWKELVRTMKQDVEYHDDGAPHLNNRSYNRSNSGNGGGGSSSSSKNNRGRLNSKGGSSNKSWSTNKDDILGLIRIGGGMKIGGNASDVISIESGLTSDEGGGTFADFGGSKKSGIGGGKSVMSANLEGWGEDGMWNPTPHGSPRKSESGVGNNNGGTVGNGTLLMRSFTPPNVPVLSTKGGEGDLPLVSPLSVDGSFDTNEEEVDGLDAPEELGLENSPVDGDKDTKKGYEDVTPPENTDTKKHTKKKKKEKSPCFFNLGESFADNTKHLWNTDDPTLSFADLSSGHDNDTNTESVSYVEQRRPTSSPPLLPMPRRSESPIVRSPSTHTSTAQQHQQYRKQGQSRSLMVQSIEGEVIPFHEMGKHQSLTREDEGTNNNIPSVFDAWTTSTSQPPLLPEEPTMSPREEPEVGVPPVRQSPTRSSKRRVKTPGPSLEEQILSVLQQQPESHVVDGAVDDDDDDDVHDDGEEFDRSSPLPMAPITATKPMKKKKKKIKSGTVGSTASAQDILRELRSSTPCTLQSGNSSCNRNNRNDPPLGSISIGHGQQQPSITEQQAVQKAQSPSEESSDNNNKLNKGPTSAAKALAPSRRDLPRPNRINRRSASEPTPVPNQGAAVTTAVAKTPSISSSQGSSTKSEIAANTPDDKSNKPPDNVKTESPHDRYRKAIGMNIKQVKSPVPPSRISRLFPNTHPSSLKRRPTPIQSTNPFDSYPSTNPFDSPPRRKFTVNTEDPFDSQSSPIAMERSGETTNDSYNADVSYSLEVDASAAQRRSASSGSVTTSSERAIAPPSSLPSRHDRLPPHPPSTLVLPPSRRDTTLRARASQEAIISPRDSRPSPPTSPQSSRSSPHNLDEIRASISQLKSNGVGGVGKSTSTLVRNEQTGRYVIRDVDDDHFDMMHTKVNNNEEDAEENSEEDAEENSEEGYVGVVETSLSSDESSYQVLPSQTKEPSPSLDGATRYNPVQQSHIKFMITNALMSESVLDDDAVDAAVQAAMDGEMSTASSSSNEDWTETEGNHEQRHLQADTEEEDFFVIQRPQNHEWGAIWSTFESSDKPSEDFDIRPSESMDDWGDDANKSQWDDDVDDGFAHSWGTDERVKAQQKEFFPSPTSVRRKI